MNFRINIRKPRERFKDIFLGYEDYEQMAEKDKRYFDFSIAVLLNKSLEEYKDILESNKELIVEYEDEVGEVSYNFIVKLKLMKNSIKKHFTIRSIYNEKEETYFYKYQDKKFRIWPKNDMKEEILKQIPETFFSGLNRKWEHIQISNYYDNKTYLFIPDFKVNNRNKDLIKKAFDQIFNENIEEYAIADKENWTIIDFQFRLNSNIYYSISNSYKYINNKLEKQYWSEYECKNYSEIEDVMNKSHIIKNLQNIIK